MLGTVYLVFPFALLYRRPWLSIYDDVGLCPSFAPYQLRPAFQMTRSLRLITDQMLSSSLIFISS